MAGMQNKTIFLEKQDTKQSEMFSLMIPKGVTFVNLEKMLEEKVPATSKKHFQIYDPEKDQYISFEDICEHPYVIPHQYLQLQIVMIRYSDWGDWAESDTPSQSSEDHKKERSKERTIKEVLQLVRNWREIHDSGVNGKKVNLQEAAKLVGISKKSLDDYYYQLRVGEKHEFDFASHLDDKIGVLRAFIKENEPQKKKKDKNARHPKKLKIIEEFDKKLSLYDAELKKEEGPDILPAFGEKEVSSIDMADSSQNLWAPQFNQLSNQILNDCEMNFFKDFEREGEDSNDPFVDFNLKMSRKSQSNHGPSLYY